MHCCDGMAAAFNHSERRLIVRNIGAMRCCELRCTVYELCGLLDRMQDSGAEEEEDGCRCWKDEGFRQVREH